MNRQTTREEDIMEDTYVSVKKLLVQVCRKFRDLYGGDFDDWLSEGNWIFMQAMADYDGRSSFSTYLYNRLHWGFYRWLRRQNCKRQVQLIPISVLTRPHPDQNGDEYLESERSELDLAQGWVQPPPTTQARAENLTGPSRTIWELLCDPPLELEGDLTTEDPLSALDALQRYCWHRLEWTWQEIYVAIQELRELCEGDQ